MHCFNHDAAPAVGICKHCNKALCRSCLTDTGNGLACTATCLQTVHDINKLIERSRNTAALSSRNVFLSPLILASSGGVFLLLGLFDKRVSSMLFAMGGCFLALAVFYFYRMRQFVAAAEAKS